MRTLEYLAGSQFNAETTVNPIYVSLNDKQNADPAQIPLSYSPKMPITILVPPSMGGFYFFLKKGGTRVERDLCPNQLLLKRLFKFPEIHGHVNTLLQPHSGPEGAINIKNLNISASVTEWKILQGRVLGLGTNRVSSSFVSARTKCDLPNVALMQYPKTKTVILILFSVKAKL